jgi:hypothetical protein
MYAACTYEMAQALDLRFLEPLAYAFLYIALAAWLAAFVGLLRSLARLFSRAERSEQRQ